MKRNNTSPWGSAEIETWFKEQIVKRSYLKEVVAKIEKLSALFDISQYGALSLNPGIYPLFLILSKNYSPTKKTILITGGVHGYETSGVHGALAFMEREGLKYIERFNIVCAPCISPWAYETINRWNSKAIDPNRSFFNDTAAEECELFMDAIESYQPDIYAHFDLHETTDTDNSVFRPAKALRDGKPEDPWSEIPDGFYLVGDSENPCPEFQKAIIDSVRKVTHIAPPDKDGKIIGEKIEQPGVVNYPVNKLSLCVGVSKAQYTTTTEVYPDSPKVTPAVCVDAQVAAVVGGLKFISNQTLN